MVYYSRSAEETMKTAADFARGCPRGSVICLTGGLGAGKTVFAKGFARGLSLKDGVTSPTFSIVNVYGGEIPLYHFDVYRIKNVSEMEDTGYEEYFYGDGICLVEWAELAAEIIPQNAVWVKIEKDPAKGDDYRIININSEEI